MKLKNRFLALNLLIAPLYCWGETPPEPTRDYTMVDLHNRLTTKLLDVGTTSITFSVEWPLDVEIDYGWFYLMGKIDIERRGWDFLETLDADQAQGKTTYEVQYADLSWNYPEDDKVDFTAKAFFAVRIPIESDSPYGPSKGKYEEDDETDVQEGWWLREGNSLSAATANAEVQDAQQDTAQTSLSSRRGKQLGVRNEESGMEGERPREPNAPAGRWLYLAILPLALAALWLMRRRKG